MPSLAGSIQGCKIASDHSRQVHHLQPPPATLFTSASADPLTSASALFFMWHLSIMCHTRQGENTRACVASEVEPEYLNTQVSVTLDIRLARIES